MGFNDHMHPRNPYKNSPPDFRVLADKFEYFRKFAKDNKAGEFSINFKDPESLRALTCALLESDFGLKLSIPLDRLIPTVPLRLNYILWIEDLLACVPDAQRRAVVRGFDIGSGASCIYALLGAKLNNWHILATEVDELSVSFAKENVKCNGLEGNIEVKQVTQGSFLKIPLEDEEIKEFDFCMCNPPFFISEFEASYGNTRSGKRPQPSGICTGAETEIVTGGGEVEFVRGIINDSLLLKEHFSWYTTMLGKKSSVAPVLACLSKNGIKTTITTEFCQGHTMRWGVAWSFLPDVKVQEIPSKRRKRNKKTKPLQFVIPDEFMATSASCETETQIPDRVTAIGLYIKKLLIELKVFVHEEGKEDKSKGIFVLQCHACEMTWAHQRRKRRENLRKVSPEAKTSESQSGCVDEVAIRDTSDETKVRTVFKSDATDLGETCESLFPESYNPSNSVKNDSNQDENASRPLLLFTLRVGAGAEIASNVSRDVVVLEIIWVDGQNKNDLYQLFQFLQNKILKGL